MWRNGRMFDLGLNGVAYAINNRGQIVGSESTKDGRVAAFEWEDGRGRDLGNAGGGFTVAYAIADGGDIVGTSAAANSGFTACLWRNGQCIDLNEHLLSKGWLLTEARGINSHGDIVGVGEFHGHRHAFLLTPTRHSVGAAGNTGIAAGSWRSAEIRAHVGTKLDPRRVSSVKAVVSAPVLDQDIECRSIIQETWPLPKRTEIDDLSSAAQSRRLLTYDNFLPEHLVHDGKSDIYLAMRFTNRSEVPASLGLVGTFEPGMTPMGPNGELTETGNSVPPNIRGIMGSPLIAPGQSPSLYRALPG